MAIRSATQDLINNSVKFSAQNLIVMALKGESQGFFEQKGLSPFYCGLGQIKAAYNLTRFLSEIRSNQHPAIIVNLGTAGSFKLKQGTLVEVQSYMQRNHFLSSNKSKINLDTKTDLPKVICGTGDTIEKMQHDEYDIMDMEGYALAYVCQQFKIPFVSIKFISDNSDENTTQHWKQNLQTAAEALLKIYLNRVW